MQDQPRAAHVGAPAHQHLATLRRALDERLSALEAALSGSRGGVPLETLVLDLARVATDEALAATELACAEAQAERDAEQAAQKAERDDMQQMLVSVKAVFMRFGQQKLAIDERFRTLEAELERTRAALAECATRARR